MLKRLSTVLACTVLCLAPSWAGLSEYSQDFEGLNMGDPAALSDDGWLIFANVFNADWSYAYGYGVFPAPNGGNGFSAIDVGQGGAEQGAQQLSIYSDYNNGDHGNGRFIEANVFQEQRVGPENIGDTWTFTFDAKRGNIEGSTAALAFFKTLDPNAGFALTNFITADMTNLPDEWGTFSLSIFLDASLEDQILQFGFLSTATGFEGSGVFYDNINFSVSCEGEDNVGPMVETFNFALQFGAPISMYVATNDDDGFAGGVVAERAYVEDCLIFDGATFGDGDGLLTDESLTLDAKELLALVLACNLTDRPNSVSFQADDCAGNTGERVLTLRRTNSQPEMQSAESESAPVNHFQRR